MAAVKLRLFGGFEARSSQGRSINVPAQKNRALLAILALSPDACQSREKLASLLWSDRGNRQARDSLKHSLTSLRHSPTVTPPLVLTDREWVKLDLSVVTADVFEFERLIAEDTLEALEQAAMLYRDDLLSGINIRDPAFEQWLRVERQRLRERVEQALTRVIDRSLAAGARDRAAAAARRLLALDPLRESACRALMQMYADQGQGAQALKLYETLRDQLHAELGVKPETETVRLYQEIRAKRVTAEASKVLGPKESSAQADTERLPLPSKPSVAVLPFENLSGDPAQQYFSDGVTEDIITELSRNHGLFVIARNSSFQYRIEPTTSNASAKNSACSMSLKAASASSVRIVGLGFNSSMPRHGTTSGPNDTIASFRMFSRLRMK